MSIKYGKSKKQYVKGKEVVNLEIYVDKEKVCVDWDDMDEYVERRDKGNKTYDSTSS